MTASTRPAAPPFTALLTDVLEAAKLAPTSVQTWIEEDSPNRPGPRLHFEIRIRSKLGAYFSGEHQTGWGHSDEEIANWIANRCVDSKDWPRWGGPSDRGLDGEYVQVRPITSFGWGPELTKAQKRQTGRPV